MGSQLYAWRIKMSAYSIGQDLKALVERFELKSSDYVVIGHDAVFQLMKLEGGGNMIVVGVTGHAYAKIRKHIQEVNGYNGVYIPVTSNLMVREGLPLKTVRLEGIPCIDPESLLVRLSKQNQQAHKVLDAHFAKIREKRLLVDPARRVPFLSLDDQLLYQSILDHRHRELSPEDEFVLKLDHIDWSYQYSDDASTWRAGNAHRKALREEAEELFGKDTSLTKRFHEITEWGYMGHDQLRKMYPWLDGYQQGRHSPRGRMLAAMESVSADYMKRLEAISLAFDEVMGLFPDLTGQWGCNGFHVLVSDTPRINDMRQMAADSGYKEYYGIAVPEQARVAADEFLKSIDIQELIDMDRYDARSKDLECFIRCEVKKDTYFTSLYSIRVYARGREYLFFKA